jgi:transketolase
MPDAPSASAASAASSAPTPVSDRRLANAVRALAMDAVEKAKSGHPGMPMGMAEIALALWRGHYRHDPANPHWPDRDRFVLSNGHGSMLQYALLHLAGYDLSIGELERFRQLGSKTPGHPEVGVTPGVETTTGPLGQGLANAVGMALAERLLAATFNRPGHEIVDHRTWVFVGDGCLMEGISHEAASLAGTWALDKLCAFYDDNGISIDGEVRNWFTDDTPARFRAYGWHVIAKVDGNDAAAVDAAIREAKATRGKPTLICCKTVIGYGAPDKEGTAEAHGAPLGAAEIAKARDVLDWHEPPFAIPADVYAGWDARRAGAARTADWNRRFDAYRAAHPDLAAEFLRRIDGRLPADFDALAQSLVDAQAAKGETIATRKASQQAIEAFAARLPEMIGGSADLTGSVFTNWSGTKPVRPDVPGNYIEFGVREFAMAAIDSGIALHGGFIPYGGTFLTFSDYSRNALRMAALMKLRNIFVFTHDSIGLGEDGPTHQSVEHTAALRLIPNLDVWRPCDTVETAVTWAAALARHDGPTAMMLSRQNIAFAPRDAAAIAAIARGGYVLRDFAGNAGARRAVVIATGSEVPLALGARDLLATEGIDVRVVSMPSTTVFDRQDAAYRRAVLPAGVPRTAVEAGVTAGWRKYVGAEDDPRAAVVGLDRFGESAPAGALFKHFDFTAEHVAAAIRGTLAA